MNKEVSVAEIKNNFSEYVAKVAYFHKRFVITKRNKPVAGLVDLETLKRFENQEESRGLATVIGKWNDFHRISKNIEKVYKSRNRDETRNVSVT